MKKRSGFGLLTALVLAGLLAIRLDSWRGTDSGTGGIVMDAAAETWEGPLAPEHQEGIHIPGYGTI